MGFTKAVSLYVALVHHPVLNRKGEVIASAVTNLDLHDMARSACTYDIPTCYVVTPLRDQQELAKSLIGHWCEGVGRELHPDRCRALERLRLVDSVFAARKEIEDEWGRAPTVWATSAQDYRQALTHRQAREQLEASPSPCLLLFGTGWGLAPSILDEVDGVLEAIPGINGYNHLSVRCAAAILMDRLLSRERSIS